MNKPTDKPQHPTQTKMKAKKICRFTGMLVILSMLTCVCSSLQAADIVQLTGANYLAWEAENNVSIETNAASPTIAWVIIPDANAGQGRALVTVGNNDTGVARSFARWSLVFKTAGTYQLYVRWRANNSINIAPWVNMGANGNSYRFPTGFGQTPTADRVSQANQSGTPNTFTFLQDREQSTANYAQFVVTQADVDGAAPKILTFGTREAGFELDRIMLSTDLALTETAFNATPNTPVRIAIVTQPASVSRDDGANRAFSFSVGYTGTPDWMQWFTNAPGNPPVAIAGASSPTYSGNASFSDNGLQFTLVLSNVFGSVTSSPAVLTVTQDLVPPTVIAVTPARSARNLTNLTVRFSEPVDSGTAQEPGNYVLNAGNLTIYTAVLQSDLTTVTLTTAPLTPDATHTLTISSVSDRAASHNVMVETNWIFSGPPSRLPPVIQVRFDEGTGVSATNTGWAGGSLALSAPVPSWANNVPAGVGSFTSVDFGTTTGNYYVESPANYSQLTGLTRFTIAGWVNCRNSTEGGGGNRVVTWINNGGDGVDLVYHNDGSLQMGINQWSDVGSPPRSSASAITTDANASASNWRFFAVTYDSTLSSGHVKYYFGSNTGDAMLDVTRDYARGAVGANISRLCIGHFNVATRGGALDRMFRGLIDEVQVFDDALSPSEIVALQRPGGTSAPVGFTSHPLSRSVLEGQPVVFGVLVTGTPPIAIQWQRNNNAIDGATNLTYSIPAASMADDGAAFRVVASNAMGQVFSSNAVLTVIQDIVPPTVIAVTPPRSARDLTHLTIQFSEPVDAGSSQEPGNYVLNGGNLTVYTAALQADLATVLLTIDPLTPVASHTLYISSVSDRAGTPNMMNETNWTFNGPPTRVPPLIQVRFEEGSGVSAANTGTVGGSLGLSTSVPKWTNNTPNGLGSASCVDFGTSPGNYYVESPANYSQLTGLTRFTIAGWVNCRNSAEGGGGNRLVTWINGGGDGADLVYHSDGSLQLGINQWPDGAPPRSSASQITTDANAGADNWRFFAVSYDSTLPSGQVKFYFGNNASEATLDVARDYARGAVGANINRLCIGHFNIATRGGATDRMFRGLMDEIQVFDDALSLQDIIAVQRPNGASAPVGFASQPVSQTVLEGQPVTFSMVVTGTPPISLQWQRNSNDIAGATSPSYTIPAATTSDDGASFRIVAWNGLGQTASSNAILTVVRDIVPPTVVAVTTARTASNLTNITVKFSEPVETPSAENVYSYALTGDNTPTAAVLQPDLTTVVLTFAPLIPDATYTLAISGVNDRAGAPNTMIDTNWTFTAPSMRLHPIVEARFEEAVGTTATNSGTMGGLAEFLVQNSFPVFSANVPTGPFAPAASRSSVDFGDITAPDGARAIDLTTARGPNGTVGALNAFTVCGWVNARNLNEGWGGNRIAFALETPGGPGFDVVQLANGSLRLGINQWPDGDNGGGPISSVGKITADPQAGPANWVFFAVTYDSSVANGKAKYYFGKPDQAVQLDVAAAYPRGPITTTGKITFGNFNTADMGARTGLGPNGPSRVFRGLMDEVQVFDDALTLEQLQTIQLSVPAAANLAVARDGSNITISWESPANFQLQYRTNLLQGAWENETTVQEVNANSRIVRLPHTEPMRFYRLKSQ